jgi:hypothetical protein
MPGESLREHETGRVAIAANKRKPERRQRISLANACGHTFPLQFTQLASSYCAAIRSKSAQNKPAALVPGIEAGDGQISTAAAGQDSDLYVSRSRPVRLKSI